MHPVRPLLVATILSLPLAGMAVCEIESGPGTAALIELFTSEGCSSCPPADQRLSRLRPSQRLVPLALHVGYWDDLGWRDPYAQAVFADRHSWLVGLDGTRTLYTPQFFVNGAATRPTSISRQVTRINDQPGRANIGLRAALADDGRLDIDATASSAVENALLYVAVAEKGLRSDIPSGENRGRQLRHDHVVRAWLGPLSLQAGRLSLQRSVALAPSWHPAHLEVSAFVQDPRTGRVLQTVGVDDCLVDQEIGS
ncbi:DUF1223 domain-containing protein [Thiorhodococcus mannitoliphagus]|uniref:DUF1223 domain-containing protein n=1 Tax=Thiorhodococcus mannitoliphagus TaxID=329406 RepID=A0A6P1E5K5_9GAMM|nr:DUF1223 domain-containing protein [Thiorhodococcus mannitoliphagus]NEX23304.1 DUF1223 domain-containing protein [Thiorhodococcus mannitoliphagus]